MPLESVDLDSPRWQWRDAQPTRDVYRGRPCVRFPEAAHLCLVDDLVLEHGTLELDVAIATGRSFHGLGWHAADGATFESFFVRPHQTGNPDSVQYTPTTNGLSAWQLYHGAGFWAARDIPTERWFTMRVAFEKRRAASWLDDLTTPALVIDDLKNRAGAGGVGILVGGAGLRVARFAWSDAVPDLPVTDGQLAHDEPGVIAAWWLSEPFPEASMSDALSREQRWTRLDAEPSGLVNLAQASGISGQRNTVLARVTLEARRPTIVPLELGYSDRAVVFLDGRPLFRGDDTYRSRDYRFLGSIGYWYTVHLPLRAGPNELVIAVSETFGGWGLQGRLVDADGIAVR